MTPRVQNATIHMQTVIRKAKPMQAQHTNAAADNCFKILASTRLLDAARYDRMANRATHNGNMKRAANLYAKAAHCRKRHAELNR